MNDQERNLKLQRYLLLGQLLEYWSRIEISKIWRLLGEKKLQRAERLRALFKDPQFEAARVEYCALAKELWPLTRDMVDGDL